MNECDGNQLLENLSATYTQKRIGDFFSGGNSAKQVKTQQSDETDGEKQSADGKARKSYAKKIKSTGYKSLNFTGLVTTLPKKLMTWSICIVYSKRKLMQ